MEAAFKAAEAWDIAEEVFAECRSPSFFFAFVTGLRMSSGPGTSLSHNSSDIGVYAAQIRARLGISAQFCKVVVLKLQGCGGLGHC